MLPSITNCVLLIIYKEHILSAITKPVVLITCQQHILSLLTNNRDKEILNNSEFISFFLKHKVLSPYTQQSQVLANLLRVLQVAKICQHYTACRFKH
jgi:hypothetical protein